MKERPILFSGSMIMALLAGTKTQTRRVMKLQPAIHPSVYFGEDAKLRAGESFKGGALAVWPGESEFDYCDCHCPYSQPGDRLWVKEKWRTRREWDSISPSKLPCADDFLVQTHLDYAATIQSGLHGKWRPSIFMPRWASRITLEIESVRVERLQEIGDDDAIAEGIEWGKHDEKIPMEGYRMYGGCGITNDPRVSYRTLWESINGAGSWDANPFVWIIGFSALPAPGKEASA